MILPETVAYITYLSWNRRKMQITNKIYDFIASKVRHKFYV